MMLLGDLLERGAPEAPALVHRGEAMSYAGLAAAAAADAAWLTAQGLRPGDRVAVYAPKSAAVVAAMFGVWRAGGVLVPINPVLKPPQVAHILADSGARFLMTITARLPALEGSLGGAQPLAIGAAPTPAASPQAPRETADLAAILYTSGSTGAPKGVMLAHANLLLAAESVATYTALQPADRALAVLPLSFDAGLSVVTSALHAGASAVLLDYLLPADVVRTIARERVTTLAAVPPLLVQLAEADWPEAARAPLRRITVTGGRMPVALTRRLRATFPKARLYLMYGLTEAFRSLYLDPAEADARPESVGKPIPHAEVLVVRPDGSLTDPDEPGELVHCGPLVAQGYWQDAERSAARFRPAPPAARHRGPAVWSGDRFRRDAEGYHYFLGREDDMIKTSGLRVSPTEVEEAAAATGAVAEAAAFGLPDARLGEAIHLVARPAGNASPADAEAALRAGMAERLPAYMLPRQVHWRTSLPRNPNGKLDRAAIRAEIAS